MGRLSATLRVVGRSVMCTADDERARSRKGLVARPTLASTEGAVVTRDSVTRRYRRGPV